MILLSQQRLTQWTLRFCTNFFSLQSRLKEVLLPLLLRWHELSLPGDPFISGKMLNSKYFKPFSKIRNLTLIKYGCFALQLQGNDT